MLVLSFNVDEKLYIDGGSVIVRFTGINKQQITIEIDCGGYLFASACDVGESFNAAEYVSIKVLNVRKRYNGACVKVGISAPAGINLDREKIYLKKKEEGYYDNSEQT